jgi:hypothetical protein
MIWIGTTAPVTFNGVSAFVVLRPDRLNPDEYAPRRTHCSTVCCMTHGLLLLIHATEEPGEGQISCTPGFFFHLFVLVKSAPAVSFTPSGSFFMDAWKATS